MFRYLWRRTLALTLILLGASAVWSAAATGYSKFWASIPPYDCHWSAILTDEELASMPPVDARTAELPLSIKDAIRLADEALRKSGFPSAERLSCRSVELGLNEPGHSSPLFYLLHYQGRVGDQLAQVQIPVLMSGKVILPAKENRPTLRVVFARSEAER